MTPDEQEALSRKYSNDIVIILPLSSGKWAVFNSARELCDIEEPGTLTQVMLAVLAHKLAPIPLPGTASWLGTEAPAAGESIESPINLEELDL